MAQELKVAPDLSVDGQAFCHVNIFSGIFHVQLAYASVY
jgi:hypothetical protein